MGAISRATSSRRSHASITARRSSRRSCSRRSPPIRSSPSTPSRPRAARSPSGGLVIMASMSPKRRRLRWSRSFRGTREAREPEVHNHGRCRSRRSWDYGFRLSLRSAGMTSLLVIALSSLSSAAEIPPDQRHSGYDNMSAATKAMQDDDTNNPATLTVLDGEALWQRKAGEAGKSCADCHGDAETTMRGVTARYPAFSPAKGRPIDIEQRINLCRTAQQKAAPLPAESRDLLALTTYLGRQSRGLPITVSEDEKTKPFIEAGRRIFAARQG